jgi:hypothetical protein
MVCVHNKKMAALNMLTSIFPSAVRDLVNTTLDTTLGV